MADNQMKIILEMIDKASPEFKKANASIISEVNKLESESKKTTDSIDLGFKKAGQELRNFRTAIIPVVAILGTMVVTTKEWAKTNENTSRAFNELSNSTKSLSSSVGSLLAPSITGLSEAVKDSTKLLTGFFEKVKEAYADLFDKITFGIQYVVAFTAAFSTGVGIAESHSIATSVAADAVEDLGTKFRKTMTEVNEGYSLLQQSEQQLAELRLLLSDTESLRKRVSVDEDIALLKYYEQTYRTAHQGMAAFSATVGKSIQTNMSAALTGIITQTSTAKEAFSQLGKEMVQTIVNFMAQKVVAWVLEKTLLAGSVAASKAAQAANVASGVAAGEALTAAYTPAAIAANIMSFGGAGVAAAASFGLASAAYATSITAASALIAGGQATGAGTGASAALTARFGGAQANGGDYLVNKPTMFLAGEAGPERATFTPLGGSGGGGSFGDINIFIQGGIRSDGSSVEDMAEKLGFEFERQIRIARG